MCGPRKNLSIPQFIFFSKRVCKIYQLQKKAKEEIGKFAKDIQGLETENFFLAVYCK